MITTLRRILRSSCYEYFSIVSLNWAETDRDVEVDVEKFTRFFILINIVVVDCPLIKLEVVNPIQRMSHPWILLSKPISITFNLSQRPLHHMHTRLIVIRQRITTLNLSRNSLDILELIVQATLILESTEIFTRLRSLEIDLTLADWFILLSRPMSIIPILGTFLSPLICTIEIVLLFGRVNSLLLK